MHVIHVFTHVHVPVCRSMFFLYDSIAHTHSYMLMQGMVIDLNLIRQILKDILAAPYKEENRSATFL
jgi:hypothetical protein